MDAIMTPAAGNLDQDYFSLLRTREERSLLEGFLAPRPSRAERLEQGRALRRQVPRALHAQHRPPAARAHPVEVLAAQNATRVQKLIPLRNARMAASSFGFLRGAAAIMAHDLAATPHSGSLVAACGDMHVGNFGLFAAAERNLIFALNDFDEVHPAPWEWDLKRLAASITVAARFLGGDRVQAEAATRAAVRSYRERMRGYARMGALAIWYDRIDEGAILAAASPRLRRRAEAVMSRARAKGHLRTLDRITERVDGAPRIIEEVPLIVRETHRTDGMPITEALDNMLRGYFTSLPDDRRRLLARYRIMDVARKVVGVGSVGTSCWVICMQGLDGADPLFLQVKEARASVLAPHAPAALPEMNQGRRVVVGQRMTQGSPDIFLGWGEDPGGHFYVRQLADMKGGARFAEGEREQLRGLDEYCALCGWALALAHAKSGDAALIAGYCGKSEALDEALAAYGRAYRAQTEADHDALLAAVRSGRMPAGEGVAPDLP